TFDESTGIDVTRAVKDVSGKTTRDVHLTGTIATAFDRSSGAPTRTLNGTLDAQFSDGAIGAITLANVVRRRGCHFPLSGTATRTLSSGASHTLVFGPNCGGATLDGKSISLHVHHRGHKGHHGGWADRGGHDHENDGGVAQ